MSCSNRMMGFLVTCLCVSCVTDGYESDVTGVAGDVCFSAEIRGEGTVAVRSILSEDIENKITQMTLASYGADGTLTATGYYEDGFSSMCLDIGKGETSNVYALANMGDMRACFPDSERFVDDMEYVVPSYSDVQTRGIPMCGLLKGFVPGSGDGVIELERLFAKLNVRILHRSLTGYDPDRHFVFNMCNRSLYVRQANGRLQPFARYGSRANSISDIIPLSDFNPDMNDRAAYDGSLSQSELGPGPGYFQDTTFVLYVPENVQGKLLPTNLDPANKVYERISNLKGKSYSEICTYLEFNAYKETPQGYSGSVMYRYYLGADNITDFSLERNRRYDITLDFTEDGFHVDSWKVTRGDDWNDTRSLCFVEEPFVVQPGKTERVMVHYHRFSSPGTDSQAYPDEWRLVYDEAAVKAAGLSLTYDPSLLVKGKNGYNDFCINVKASDNAKVGASVPLRVETRDGSIVDETLLTVVEKVEFSLIWDSRPEYVSQYGKLLVAGVDDDDYPLSLNVSGDDCCNIQYDGHESFKVIARKPGNAVLTVSNASGTKTLTESIVVDAPVLVLGKSYVELSPDGTADNLSYEYRDRYGNILSRIHEATFYEQLKPVLGGSANFGLSLQGSSINVYVSRIYEDGVQMGLDRQYSLNVSASGCQQVKPVSISAYVKDPFSGVVSRDYGSVDDYSLFSLAGTSVYLKESFEDEMKRTSVYEFDCDMPMADDACVTAALEPLWRDAFSYANGVFQAVLDPLENKVRLKVGPVSATTFHSAGKHNLVLYVTNRFSSESISCVCGIVDVYVHTAVGAMAKFGKQQCGYYQGGSGTFAEVYDEIRGRPVYQYYASGDMIHFADVSLEWMTDVSKVCLFDKMNGFLASGSGRLDVRDIVRPSVQDGYVDSNLRLLYSVCRMPDRRLTVGGEEYGPRCGIGVTLYRMLLSTAYDYELSQSGLMQQFFGYDPQAGFAPMTYAARYTLHDMNLGDDQSENIITSREPYYFSPSEYSSYKDEDGKGYHVIHFLENLAPYTGGWANLL